MFVFMYEPLSTESQQIVGKFHFFFCRSTFHVQSCSRFLSVIKSFLGGFTLGVDVITSCQTTSLITAIKHSRNKDRSSDWLDVSGASESEGFVF